MKEYPKLLLTALNYTSLLAQRAKIKAYFDDNYEIRNWFNKSLLIKWGKSNTTINPQDTPELQLEIDHSPYPIMFDKEVDEDEAERFDTETEIFELQNKMMETDMNGD